MKQSCKICTNQYNYCHPCAITKNPYKNAGYCSEDCYHISMILQKYGSNIISAEEAVAELQPYGIDTKELQQNISEYYNNIKQSIVPKTQNKKAQKSKNKIFDTEEITVSEDTSSFSTEACVEEDIETTLTE